MLVPELQRRQNNSVAKRKQIVFLQFPVWKWTSSRKQTTNSPLHLLWRHVRPILVSGELYEHCWLLLHALEFSRSHVTKNQSICFNLIYFSESLNKDWHCMIVLLKLSLLMNNEALRSLFTIILYWFLSFLDINECQDDSHDCDKNANCTNTVGSFTCSCNPGFFGNGSSCTGT